MPPIGGTRTCLFALHISAYRPKRTSAGRAARYIDRIFKGDKPTDMAVQAAAKYEVVPLPDELIAWLATTAFIRRSKRTSSKQSAAAVTMLQSTKKTGARCTWTKPSFLQTAKPMSA